MWASISTSGSSIADSGLPAQQRRHSYLPIKMTEEVQIEQHPLQPFVPEGARLLMMGSFPPPRRRWRMDFFYPNFQNDMWRIFGLILHEDPLTYLEPSLKTFHLDAIRSMLTRHHIALYDAACSVRRLDGNASDARLEVVEPTDLESLLQQMPECVAVASTGGRSAEVLSRQLGCARMPGVGASVEVTAFGRRLLFFRMPSSSRAYPMKLERKAEAYRRMLMETGCLNV